MINNKTVAVVVPCYNEESQIKQVIKNMPEFVDRIVVVNDLSEDQTEAVVKSLINNEVYNSTTEINPKRVVPNPYNRAEQVLEKVNEEEIKFYTPQKIEESKSKIILINHLQNGGVGAAIASGYKWCKDNQIDCSAVMAGDGQMDPNELDSICRPVIEEGIYLVSTILSRIAKT